MASRTAGDGDQYPEQPQLEITQGYDGNGQSLKRNQVARQNMYDLETGLINGVDEANTTTYYLRSSVLGGAIIDEIGRDWQNNVVKTVGDVYAGGERIARQSSSSGNYEHHNPLTGSWIDTNASNRYMSRQERDPADGTIPLEKPASQYNYVAANFGGALLFIGGDPSDYSGGYIDGMPATSADVARGRENGSIEPCRNNNCGAQSMTVTARGKDGGVIATSTFLASQGQAGWNGSLDGTYGVFPWFAASFDFNSPASGALFASSVASIMSRFGERNDAFVRESSGAPQNSTTPGQRDLTSLISQARDVIKNATGKCAELLGKDAVSKFDTISGSIQFNGDILVGSAKLSDVSSTSAVTVGDQIYLNPDGYAFGKFYNFPALSQLFTKYGAADQHQFALATILHEFLHTTGKFKPDSKTGPGGEVDSSKSEKYQKEVLKKCFSNK